MKKLFTIFVLVMASMVFFKITNAQYYGIPDTPMTASNGHWVPEKYVNPPSGITVWVAVLKYGDSTETEVFFQTDKIYYSKVFFNNTNTNDVIFELNEPMFVGYLTQKEIKRRLKSAEIKMAEYLNKSQFLYDIKKVHMEYRDADKKVYAVVISYQKIKKKKVK